MERQNYVTTEEVDSSKIKIILIKIKDLMFNFKLLPLTLLITIIAITTVTYRMRGLEQRYKLNTIESKIEKVQLENKELKAKKAKALSIKNIRKIAKQYKLKAPKQKQIIIIP